MTAVTKILPRAVYGFPESAAAAEKLAGLLNLPCLAVEIHRFPDGESLVRLPAFAASAILYRSLNDPNDKLIELILASAELRTQGAGHITLVTPYLAYMRQDIAFRPGEAVSQKIIGPLIALYFNRILTVNPHLHRTPELGMVFPGRAATALTAAGLIGQSIAASTADKPLLIGPDAESAPLVENAAAACGATWATANKVRRGDRNVSVELPAGLDVKGRHTIIIDDVISSGATILDCAEALFARGAARVDVYTVHALFGPDIAATFTKAGISDVISCDSVPHPSNRISLAPLFCPPFVAKELTDER
jgi:ribose-phosphate pyrophosphokinase